MKELEYCLATAGDIDEMRSTLFEHGPNDWNYLPEQGVVQELKDVADGKAIGVLAKSEEVMLGFAVAYPRYIHFPKYTDSNDSKEFGYIGDVVIKNEFVGKGVGMALLEATKKVLFAYNIRWVDIDCHEENKPSRGMMRKAGFKEVAIYLDVERRTVGSCNTWIGRCSTSTGIY